MIPALVQVLVVFLTLLPSLPALAGEVASSGSLWAALAHAVSGHMYAVAIGVFYVLELAMRGGARMRTRSLASETVLSFAVIHMIVATIVLLCLTLELSECSDVSQFRLKLLSMQYQLAVVGLSLFHATREMCQAYRKVPGAS